ncbi:MAG: hypothetical protein GTN60_18815 [Pseudomonas stutzeri]|nr:hypothetical protein [Stutzerimonas stutzeri]NIP02723.1 hypothetical protein [Stutzerimonas stutzeri]NIQ43176.1 hypothetical protein [Stutzerimonas stutzeri]
MTNVLPCPDRPWKDILQQMASPHRNASVVHLEDYQNRILLMGRVASAAQASRRIRDALAAIGSMQSDRISVRRLSR